MAWTSVGGDLLHIEALKLPGKGRMKTTGKLGDVMKESIDAASSYVRSISPEIGVKPPKFDKIDNPLKNAPHTYVELASTEWKLSLIHI